MFYDDKIKEYGDINCEINKLYCQKYNIDFMCSHEKSYNDRHSAWERLPLLIKHIHNYDYLIWIDSDAFFYIDGMNILDIINNNNNTNFIFSNDITGLNVNTGIFIVKNSKYSIDFLNRWAYDEELYKNNRYPGWWDQGVLIDMINENILDIKNNYITYNYGILQHFYEEELLTFNNKPLVRHLAGRTTQYRLYISTNYYRMIQTLNEFETKPNPFLIDIPDKEEYTIEDYINIQKQLSSKNIDNWLQIFYTDKNKFYDLPDFKRRISRGIQQKLLDINNNLFPTKKLYKIGNGGNKRNCIVCCTSLSHIIENENENNTRFIASQQIVKSLEQVGFNGHVLIMNGGFPNPTGTEMKYVGVPYCFKIFMMLEAEKMGFDKVIWIDSGCYALNNPEILFDILGKDNTIMRKVFSNNNYDAMSFQSTIKLLNKITNCDIHNAYYIETIVFGLNLESEIVKEFIKEYYEMVKMGWPFFSIFPEEIVFTALFNKPEYKPLLVNNPVNNKLQVHEKNITEPVAKEYGFYFHHKDYLKYV